MELAGLLQTIREYLPEKAVENSETLGLLRENLDDTRSKIKKVIMELYDQGRHEAILPHNQLGSALLEYMAGIQEIRRTRGDGSFGLRWYELVEPFP